MVTGRKMLILPTSDVSGTPTGSDFAWKFTEIIGIRKLEPTAYHVASFV